MRFDILITSLILAALVIFWAMNRPATAAATTQSDPPTQFRRWKVISNGTLTFQDDSVAGSWITWYYPNARTPEPSIWKFVIQTEEAHLLLSFRNPPPVRGASQMRVEAQELSGSRMFPLNGYADIHFVDSEIREVWVLLAESTQ